jgi:hypothetical protein
MARFPIQGSGTGGAGPTPPPFAGFPSNTLNSFFLFDDFFYSNPPTTISEIYNVYGTGEVGDASDTNDNGQFNLRTSELLGSVVGVTTTLDNAVILGNRSWEVNLILKFDGETNTIGIAGLTSGETREGTTIASLIASFGHGAWFDFDSASSANWRAVTKSNSSGLTTTTDTGVVVFGASFYRLRIINTRGVDTKFFIGSPGLEPINLVATHTTNLPDDEMIMNISYNNKQALQNQNGDIDMWQWVGERRAF